MPLIIAFVILAAYTYSSGLRAPAMIALVKDLMIYITVLAAVIIIPAQLGGYGHIFQAAGQALPQKTPPGNLILGNQQMFAYASLAFGSALALFLYPHSVTGVLSSNSRDVIKRNTALLPAYSFLLGLIALLGYMAIAAGVATNPRFTAFFTQYKANFAVPALFLNSFPDWFAGFAFAAIAIGALVPAAIMSIAASNLFTRNIYKEYFRPNCTDKEESQVAKLVSLIVKAGALSFIIFGQTQYAIYLQLLGGVWIIQTLPSIVIGLYTRWFHRWALLAGWLVGMVAGTLMSIKAGGVINTTYPLQLGGLNLPGYAAVYSLILNFVVAAILTVIFRAARVAEGTDSTKEPDYEAESVAKPATV